jgi:hypothetical protein
MKISSLGPATLGCALALAAGSVFANVTPNLQDASGNAVKDGSGACVVTSGQVLPSARAPSPRPRRLPPRPRGPRLPPLLPLPRPRPHRLARLPRRFAPPS